MPTTDGMFWQQLTSVKALLAASTNFQAWVGTPGNALGAADMIWEQMDNPDLTQPRWATLAYAHPWGGPRDVTGVGECAFVIDRDVLVILTWLLDPDLAHTRANSAAFGQFFGLMLKYFCDNSWGNGAGSLHFTAVRHHWLEKTAVPGDWHVHEVTTSGRKGYRAAILLEEKR